MGTVIPALILRNKTSNAADVYFPISQLDKMSLPAALTIIGSISVSGQLPTYPSPNPTLTLTCCQLTVVELGEG